MQHWTLITVSARASRTGKWTVNAIKTDETYRQVIRKSRKIALSIWLSSDADLTDINNGSVNR